MKKTYDNGRIYEGDLVRDTPSGSGTMVYATSEKWESYTGSFRDGKLHGYGILRFKSGEIYVGEFQDSYYKKGTKLFPQDSIWLSYEGEFHKNILEGVGILRFKNGAYYEGHFKNGKYHGKGHRGFSAEEKWESYEGDFEANQFHGQGTLKFKNGSYYEGGFQNGKYSGFGSFYSHDGHVTSGEWEDNIPKRSRAQKGSRPLPLGVRIEDLLPNSACPCQSGKTFEHCHGEYMFK